MARSLPVLAVVACIAVSGCAALSGVGDSGHETVSLSEVDYPEHTGEDGIENNSAFFDAMYEPLQDQGFTITRSAEIVTTEEGDENRAFYKLAEHDPETSEWNLTTVRSGGETTNESSPDENPTRTMSYVDGETGYVFHPSDDEELRTYSAEVLHDTDHNQRPQLSVVLNETDATASHAVQREDAVQIVYNVTEHLDRSTSGRLVIDERGVLREFTVEYTDEDEGQIVTEISVTPEAPSIERPEWVPRANSTSTTSTTTRST